MPPVREREEDIMLLARHFLLEYNRREGKRFGDFSYNAQIAIEQYRWPGNVRQLQNAISQVVVLNDGNIVEGNMLPEVIYNHHTGVDVARKAVSNAGNSAKERSHLMRRQQVDPLWLVEKKAIEKAIECCDGNIHHAAGLLEVHASTLYRKLKSW
jgi:two-component system repressor protein LuxO